LLFAEGYDGRNADQARNLLRVRLRAEKTKNRSPGMSNEENAVTTELCTQAVDDTIQVRRVLCDREPGRGAFASNDRPAPR
jgi:hypothetical protein